nr:MAG: replication associated protein [Cressdnaviricota sp.]
MLTFPFASFSPLTVWEDTTVTNAVSWIKGQNELSETGYNHWQVCLAFKGKKSLAFVNKLFPGVHAELTRSEQAAEYVWKDDTAVPGTRFEFGAKPFRRNSKVEWESVWDSAQAGDLLAVPANVRVVSYRTLRSIAADYDKPKPMERVCNVFWGSTGTGKSRRAWEEAGMDAYCKDPRSKFWCGYRNGEHVVIDEFRGGIDISHVLRWLDRYPCRVEIKGSSVPLVATTIWITSNLSPEQWYPDVDPDTVAALMRRLTVVHFPAPL